MLKASDTAMGVKVKGLLGTTAIKSRQSNVYIMTPEDPIQVNTTSEHRATRYITYDGKEVYLVTPEMVAKYGQQMSNLHEAVLLHGKMRHSSGAIYDFILPVREGKNKNTKEIRQQLADAIKQCKGSWFALKFDEDELGKYCHYKIHSNLHQDVDWEETPFSELLDQAIGDRIIANETHPLLSGIANLNAKVDLFDDDEPF